MNNDYTEFLCLSPEDASTVKFKCSECEHEWVSSDPNKFRFFKYCPNCGLPIKNSKLPIPSLIEEKYYYVLYKFYDDDNCFINNLKLIKKFYKVSEAVSQIEDNINNFDFSLIGNISKVVANVFNNKKECKWTKEFDMKIKYNPSKTNTCEKCEHREKNGHCLKHTLVGVPVPVQNVIECDKFEERKNNG